MATGATEFIDNTTADNMIPEIWSQEAIIARENALCFANHATRKYEADAKIGDKININNIGNLSAQTNDPTTTTATLYETITEGTVQITIATWAYSAIAVQTATAKQVNRNLIETYAPKQGYALGLKVDDDLAGLVDDFTQNVGTLASGLTYADMLRGRQYLDDADVPQDKRCLIISPAEETNMLQMTFFQSSDYKELRGSPQTGNKEKAWMGHWLGIPVFKTVNVEGTNAAGHDNALFHEEALALVMQIHPTSYTFFDVDYLARKVVVEQLYGVREIRDDHGVWMKGA